MRKDLVRLISLLAVAAASQDAFAQAPPSGTLRPQDSGADRLRTPELAPAPPGLDLPALSQLAPGGAIENQVTFTLSAVQVRGAAVASASEIDAITARYVGRPISLLDVSALVDEITKLYIDRGYVNSGARAPDQDISGGVLLIDVTEGALGEIVVTGAKALSSDYVADRLRIGLRPPFDFYALQRNFQVLAEDPNIAEIDARLRPSGALGEAALDVAVRERPRFAGEFTIASERSPSIGGHRAGVESRLRSALIPGDLVTFGFGAGERFQDVHLGYAAPLNARDWRISFSVDAADSEVVEKPFDVLDIESDGQSYRVDLTAPIIRTFGRRYVVGVGLEQRDSRLQLAGSAFPLEAKDGEASVAFARLSQQFVLRAREQALAVQADAHFGLEAPDAPPGLAPFDENFVLLLGQARFLRQLTPLDQLNLAADFQISDSRLPSSMRFPLGGIDSVRGYRRSAVTGDDAVRLSAEWRRDLPRRAFGVSLPELTSRLFVEGGQVWDELDAGGDGPSELLAAGLEIEWRITPSVSLVGYAAAPLGDEISAAEDNLQDDGFGYRLTARF